MNRRGFLYVLGGGVVVSAGAAAGYALTRTPEKALAPWDQAGNIYSEPRKRALSYAILAPNPHNRQPWLVDLSEEGRVKLYVDTDRLLPHTDPLGRQIIIGLGCFLEQMRMAAAEDGYRVEMTLFPEGFDNEKLDGRPVAIAEFVKDPSVVKDPLFAHVLQRRSLKAPYDLNRPVSGEVLKKIAGVTGPGVVSGVTGEQDDVVQLRKLTHEAMQLEIDVPRTYRESVDLFRIGKAEIEKNPDGLSFPGLKYDLLSVAGIFTREQALDTSSESYRAGIRAILENCDTGMAYIWLVTTTNTRIDQIAAGRDWVRINLAATASGVGIQPMSQALQEYPEMKNLYESCHKKLAPAGGAVQMLGRLGYAAQVPPTPRWPLAAKIMKA